jgi:hypothetical protein
MGRDFISLILSAALAEPLGQGRRMFANIGQPLDLTNAQFEWVLVDTGGNPITLAAEVDVMDAAARRNGHLRPSERHGRAGPWLLH